MKTLKSSKEDLDEIHFQNQVRDYPNLQGGMTRLVNNVMKSWKPKNGLENDRFVLEQIARRPLFATEDVSVIQTY